MEGVDYAMLLSVIFGTIYALNFLLTLPIANKMFFKESVWPEFRENCMREWFGLGLLQMALLQATYFFSDAADAHHWLLIAGSFAWGTAFLNYAHWMWGPVKAMRLNIVMANAAQIILCSALAYAAAHDPSWAQWAQLASAVGMFGYFVQCSFMPAFAKQQYFAEAQQTDTYADCWSAWFGWALFCNSAAQATYFLTASAIAQKGLVGGAGLLWATGFCMYVYQLKGKANSEMKMDHFSILLQLCMSIALGYFYFA